MPAVDNVVGIVVICTAASGYDPINIHGRAGIGRVVGITQLIGNKLIVPQMVHHDASYTFTTHHNIVICKIETGILWQIRVQSCLKGKIDQKGIAPRIVITLTGKDTYQGKRKKDLFHKGTAVRC